MDALTEPQQNLIKDVLKFIGNNDEINGRCAQAVKLRQDEFDTQMDEIFVKLGNGRITVEEA